LILWKLYDPDCLTRKNVQGIDNKRALFMRKSLLCLDFALRQFSLIESVTYDLIHFCHLRILYLMKSVRGQIHFTVCHDLRQEILEDFQIGDILLSIQKYQAAIDFNRRNYEKLSLNMTDYPELKVLCFATVRNYATSYFKAFMAFSSQNSDVGNVPPYHYLEEAERLIRDQLRKNDDNFMFHVQNTELLCQIFMYQKKYTEAKNILSPCLQKLQRVYGLSHPITRRLFLIDMQIWVKVNKT